MSKRIESLDFLKALLVLFVLAAHYFGTVCFEDVSRENNPALFSFTSIISGFLRGQSVPIYFFISGYLFFLGGEFSIEKYYKKLRRRIKSLLVPYVVWNTIAIILLIIVLLSPLVSMMKYGDKLDISFINILSCYWSYDGALAGVNVSSEPAPIDMPLWYIRDLMVMVVLSPVIRWLLTRLKVVFLILTCGLWVWFSIQTPSIYFPRDGIFFFSLGAYFSLNGKDIVSILSKWYKPSMVVYIILSIILSIIFFYNIENLYCLKLLNILIGIVFYISFAEYLSHGKIINATQKYFGSAYFIYLSHGIICSKMIKLIMIIIKPSNDLGYIMTDVLSYVISILLLYGTYRMLEKFTPKVLSLLLGR